MARVSPLLLLPLAVTGGLLVLGLAGLGRDNPQDLPSARLGQVAPPLTVQPLGAREGFDAADLTTGGVKLVNFWASWCAPCRVEHPNLSALAAGGMTIYGVNYGDEPAKAEAFLTELGSPYAAIVADPERRTGLDWGLYGVPETFVLDEDGRVILRIAGPMTERVISETLRPALEKAAGG